MNGLPLIPAKDRPHVQAKHRAQIEVEAYRMGEARTFNDLREVGTRLRAIAADVDRTADEQEAAWHRRTQ